MYTYHQLQAKLVFKSTKIKDYQTNLYYRYSTNPIDVMVQYIYYHTVESSTDSQLVIRDDCMDFPIYLNDIYTYSNIIKRVQEQLTSFSNPLHYNNGFKIKSIIIHK